MRAGARIAYAVLLISLARFTVPGIAAAVRQAIELWPLSPHERRVRIVGPFYEGVMNLAQTLPPHEPIAFLVGRDFGTGLFMNFYLFPRRTALYADLEHYRSDPGAPKNIIRVGDEARFISYGEARALAIGDRHVVRRLEASTQPFTRLDLPLASSGDGPPPDRYTTEGIVVNGGSDEATVTVRLFPMDKAVTFKLAPGEQRTWNDLVWQLFGRLEAGWLRIESDQPLRGRFWFVNRGRGDADLVPPARFAKSHFVPHRGGSRIWLLNPHDRRLAVRLTGGEHHLDPRALVPIEWPVDLLATSDDEFYVYQSWRDENGMTHFFWPEVE